MYGIKLTENGDDSGVAIEFEAESYRFEGGWAVFVKPDGEVIAVQNHYVKITGEATKKEVRPIRFLEL